MIFSYRLSIILFILFLVFLIKKEIKILILIFIIILFLLYFYRLPNINLLRLKHLNSKFILSPAYGMIQNIQEINNHIIITIVLTIFDIHAQYIPYDGQIIEQKYIPGKFNMLGFKMNNNEQNRIIIQTRNGPIEIIQYAGYFTRRISSNIRIRDKVNRGEIYGFISFGSRVDIRLPKERVKLNVKVGQKVKGSNTIISQWL